MSLLEDFAKTCMPGVFVIDELKTEDLNPLLAARVLQVVETPHGRRVEQILIEPPQRDRDELSHWADDDTEETAT